MKCGKLLFPESDCKNNGKVSEAAMIFKQTYGVQFIIPEHYENSKISITKERTTAEEIILLLAIQLNLKTKKINDRTFKLEE